MLRLSGLRVERGGRTLVSGIEATLAEGDRVGLIGANGCGKSSLLAVIAGRLAPAAGDLIVPAPELISEISQTSDPGALSALELVMSADRRLVAARSRLAELSERDGGHELAQAVADEAEANPGAVRARALAILAGLGFDAARAERPARLFSGGERRRLALARALLAPGQLLLLDEPTNHLDLNGIVWLEEWLARQRAGAIIISHDRDFLDHCCRAVWAIEDGRLWAFRGNLSGWEEERLRRRARQEAERRATERQAERLRSYIERFGAKATKARQAQSRRKALARLAEIEPLRAERAWRFSFPAADCPRHLLELEQVSLGWDGRPLLSRVSLSVRAGDRIGVLGRNGAGKSTLMAALAGELAPLGGAITRGRGLNVGYLAQRAIADLDPEATPLLALRRRDPAAPEKELRDWLGRFRFGGDSATARPIATLSPGEQVRLCLALLARGRPNLLLLDEPTNHLDLPGREALGVALADFSGALVLVGHDRWLMRQSCDRLLVVAGGLCREYEGDLDEWSELLRAESGPSRPSAPPRSDGRREARRQAAEARREREARDRPRRRRLSEIEDETRRLAERGAEIDALFGDPGWQARTGSARKSELARERGLLARRQEELEAEWLALSERLEGD